MVSRLLEETEGEATLDSIWNALLDEQMQCWTVQDGDELKGIILTEVTQCPAFKMLQVIGCVGDGLLDVVDYVLAIENWARHIGCTKIRLEGRKGWVRVLKPYGWRESYTVVMKDL